MHANALVVMAKAPLAGEVKTRLVPALSAEEAARLARALLVDQLNHLRAIDDADLYLAFAPEHGRALMAALAPPFFCLFPQEAGDLGARMQSAFEKLFHAGHRQVILIGGDLPPVPIAFFERAYAYLDRSESRVVLGPSRDGGYYLVGLNCQLPEMFKNMTWSHDGVLAQTLERLARLDIAYEILPVRFDIDTIEDLRSLRHALESGTLAEAMPETGKLLQDPQIRRSLIPI